MNFLSLQHASGHSHLSSHQADKVVSHDLCGIFLNIFTCFLVQT